MTALWWVGLALALFASVLTVVSGPWWLGPVNGVSLALLYLARRNRLQARRLRQERIARQFGYGANGHGP